MAHEVEAHEGDRSYVPSPGLAVAVQDPVKVPDPLSTPKVTDVRPGVGTVSFGVTEIDFIERYGEEVE